MKLSLSVVFILFGLAFSGSGFTQTAPGTPENPVPVLPPGTSVIAVAKDGSVWKCTGTTAGVTCTLIQPAPIPPPPPKER